jgi:hypothetical protein
MKIQTQRAHGRSAAFGFGCCISVFSQTQTITQGNGRHCSPNCPAADELVSDAGSSTALDI